MRNSNNMLQNSDHTQAHRQEHNQRKKSTTNKPAFDNSSKPSAALF